jgi:hypothetical protein
MFKCRVQRGGKVPWPFQEIRPHEKSIISLTKLGSDLASVGDSGRDDRHIRFPG